MNQAPSIGRIVHVTLQDHRNDLIIRPGIIVRTWPDAAGNPTECINVQVFADGNGQAHLNDGLPAVVWKTSVHYREKAGEQGMTWSWPAKA